MRFHHNGAVSGANVKRTFFINHPDASEKNDEPVTQESKIMKIMILRLECKECIKVVHILVNEERQEKISFHIHSFSRRKHDCEQSLPGCSHARDSQSEKQIHDTVTLYTGCWK